ncbi:hypothetical protein [Oceanobacillus sp. CF4.6]|uniref:hypothetical protein n=1 Tax=Oceanobacillus sp. CF4.6 TaxID=3373080 RepID=UPI003EE78F9A
MSAILDEMEMEKNGISIDEAKLTIQEMTDQLLLIDQKLKINVDREVWLHFQNEIHQIDHTKNAIEKITR